MPFRPITVEKPTSTPTGFRPVSDILLENDKKASTPTPSQPTGIMGKIGGAISSGVSSLAKPYQELPGKIAGDISTGADTINKGGAVNAIKGVVQSGLRTAGDVAGAIYSPISATVGGALDKTGIQGHIIQPIAQAIVDKSGITDVKGVQDWATAHPNAAEDFGRLMNIGMAKGETGKIEPKTILPRTAEQVKTGASALDTGLAKVENVAGQAKSNVADLLTSKLNEKKVSDLYNRAIKPTVVGKSNAGQIEKANTQALSGLKSIADNKANLSFTDANGEVITGETPKSVDHLTQAIDQTKKSIFQQYDGLAKQAGEQGVQVDTTKIGAELKPVIESKSLALVNPKAVEYAKSLQDRLTQTESLDAETAQQVIQHYNDSLKAFYKNPSPELASNVSIDAMIANNFRKALDEGITGATGEQYQALKNQYGALSSMEKDVAHRNVVWGRQNNVGLAGNLANITSGAELVRGLITMNPADIASSVAIKGVQKYIKYLNNPDVGVTKIFSELEKPSLPSKESTIPTTPVKQVNGSLDTTIPQSQYKSKTFQDGEALSKKISETPNKQGGFISTGKTADSSLLTEAMKYKTAEEFVKAQGTPVYHATTKDFTEFDINKAKTDMGGAKAVFFSDTPEATKYYQRGNYKIVESAISPEAKIFDYKNDIGIIDKYVNSLTDYNVSQKASVNRLLSGGDWGKIESKDFQNFLKKEGYDGFKVMDMTGNEATGITNSDVIKTKSQLTSIWNKANKK